MKLEISKRNLNKQLNRKAILDAAQQVFLTHGYDGVTIRDVIRATRLAAGTFYNYFTDKETLFEELLEARATALNRKLSAVRAAAKTLEAFLYESYMTVFEEIRMHPDFYAMVFRNEPTIRSMREDTIMGISMRALRKDLQGAVRRGLLPKMDVDCLTALFFGAGYEMARLISAKPEKNIQQASLFVTRIFLSGIQHQAPPTAKLIRRGSLTLNGSAR